MIQNHGGAEMDYRTLLIKYIAYIRDVEGTDYIDPHDERWASGVAFTTEEWGVLQSVHDEQMSGMDAPARPG
jgi:hypothetical protein